MGKEKTKNVKVVSVGIDNQRLINNILKNGGRFLYFSMDMMYYEVNKTYNL